MSNSLPHIANYSEFELYLQDEHFETIASKMEHFYLFDPCRATNLTLGQKKKKLLYWRNPTDPKIRPDPTFFLKTKKKKKDKKWPTDPKKSKTCDFFV